MEGTLICSKAGHDKNRIYMILKETPEYIYVVDGVIKKISNPKKKNKKHIQKINLSDQKEMKLLIQNNEITDEIIKRYIKLYCNTI